jgi:hypothetical protein
MASLLFDPNPSAKDSKATFNSGVGSISTPSIVSQQDKKDDAIPATATNGNFAFTAVAAKKDMRHSSAWKDALDTVFGADN